MRNAFNSRLPSVVWTTWLTNHFSCANNPFIPSYILRPLMSLKDYWWSPRESSNTLPPDFLHNLISNCQWPYLGFWRHHASCDWSVARSSNYRIRLVVWCAHDPSSKDPTDALKADLETLILEQSHHLHYFIDFGAVSLGLPCGFFFGLNLGPSEEADCHNLCRQRTPRSSGDRNEWWSPGGV